MVAGEESAAGGVPLIDFSAKEGRRAVLVAGGVLCMCGAGTAKAEGSTPINPADNQCRECAGYGATPCDPPPPSSLAPAALVPTWPRWRTPACPW